jgi:hypothetical protein
MTDSSHTLLADMAGIIQRSEQVLAELRSERGRIDGDIARIVAFRKAMGVKDEGIPRRRSKAKTVKRVRTMMNRDHDRYIARAILSIDQEEFTVQDIWALVGRDDLNMATTAQTFRRMRSVQFIGKMGTNAKHKQLWRIIDATEAEQYVTPEEATV